MKRRVCDFWGIGFFRVILFLLRSLPESVYFGLTAWSERWFFRLFSSRLRRSAKESLAFAFREALPDAAIEKIVRGSFQSLYMGLAGFFYDYKRPDRVQARFILYGREHLDAALKEGRGAVIAVAHFGPFVWMLLKLAACGYKINIVARPPRSNVFGYFYANALAICGLRIILSVPPRSCITACVRALQGNEVVVTPIDQNYGGPGRVFVDFFGRPAATAPGTVLFARGARSPILFAYALPEQAGRFCLNLEPAVPGPDQEAPAQAMGRLTGRLEDLVRRYPGYWSWMHRRWKAVPKEGEGCHG